MDHEYDVDFARYHKQLEEYKAGRPVPDISADEAETLFEEHLRHGKLIEGRRGWAMLKTAAEAGDKRVMGPELIQRINEELKQEEEHEFRTAEAGRVEADGPDFDWITVEVSPEATA